METFDGPKERVDVEVVVGSESKAVQIETGGFEVIESGALSAFAVKPVAALMEGDIVFGVA